MPDHVNCREDEGRGEPATGPEQPGQRAASGEEPDSFSGSGHSPIMRELRSLYYARQSAGVTTNEGT
jgi:hypothetical protein